MACDFCMASYQGIPRFSPRESVDVHAMHSDSIFYIEISAGTLGVTYTLLFLLCAIIILAHPDLQ